MRDLLSRLLRSAADYLAPACRPAPERRTADALAAPAQIAALRLALGSLVWVARGKADMAKVAEEDLLALGIELPLRELAGRIEASRRVNPWRREAEESRVALESLQRAHGLLLAAFNGTVRALSLASGADHELTRRAVERAKVALAAQSPAMHLDIAAVVTRMGVPPADALLTEGNPLYVGAAGCERCGNDPGTRHGTCADVAADDDEPAIGDEPTLVSQ